ncbi:MAG: peptidylprolyl isomerase [Clostridia bacterium]|nr:peptidylprolyl isomerase [Clostridia bacterium]
MKKFSFLTVILSIAMMLTSCKGGNEKAQPTPTPIPTIDPILAENSIEATITLESGDEIELELYPELAPKTVDNFVELAEDGFYDGTIFHRVIEDFMIQGGGYDENLKEQKASTIEGEFAANNFENTLSHTRGVISMARAQQFDSASSQFFIVQQDATYLDGQYAAFGIVTDGMDVVDEIASSRTGSVSSAGMDDVPVKPIVIESITIGSGSSASNKTNGKNNSKNNAELDEDDLSDEDVINSLFGSENDSDSSSSGSSSSSSGSSSSRSGASSSSSGSSSSSSGSSSSRGSGSSNNSAPIDLDASGMSGTGSSDSSSSGMGSFDTNGASGSSNSSNKSSTSGISITGGI